MQTVSATELARRLREILDGVEFRGQVVTIMRNKRPIARLLPGAQEMDAIQALSDIYGVVGEEVADGWAKESRVGGTLADEVRDPWAS